MALSKELLAYIGELEKIDKWDKLPKTDPRIIKLQELAKNLKEEKPQQKNIKKVVVFKEGKFVKVYNNAFEASEGLGMTAHAIRAMARGDRRCPEGLRIEYIKSEVD